MLKIAIHLESIMQKEIPSEITFEHLSVLQPTKTEKLLALIDLILFLIGGMDLEDFFLCI